MTIGREIEACMLEWGIDSIYTVTVDNATSNDGALDYLKRRTKDGKSTILENEFMHVRCCAHILNLIVMESLKEVNTSILKVQNAVKYVKSSPSRLEKFKSCVEKQKIGEKGLLCLDVPMRWNSTYLMLKVAEQYQGAFDLLQEDDGQFVSQLSEGGGGLGLPTFGDWDIVRAFMKFLKLFYEVTLRISGSLYTTSNLFFQELSTVYDHLQGYCEDDDYLLSTMTMRMKSKYDKYWGHLDNINLMLFVAIVLDPQYKLDALEFWLNDNYKGEDEVVKVQLVENIKRVIHRLCQQYTRFSVGCVVGSSVDHEKNVSSAEMSVQDQVPKNFMNRYRKYRAEKGNVDNKSELDRYLMEDVEFLSINFDILNWWKVNSSKFPILAKIARDVLAIPISTVASESTFSTGGRILDPFRSCLAPKTVEGLICAQNWLQSSSIAYDFEDVLEDLESYKLDSGFYTFIIMFLLFVDEFIVSNFFPYSFFSQK